MMPKKVIDVHFEWKGWFGKHRIFLIWNAAPVCSIWREKNNHTFSAVESSIVELKSVFLRWLIEWSRVLGTTSMTSFTDLIDSLPFYCNSLHRHPV